MKHTFRDILVPVVITTMFMVSCQKEDKTGDAELTTGHVSEITYNSAKCGGNILSDGGAAIQARGVCWGTNPGPTADNNKTSDSTGIGIFTSTLTNLSPNTLYYARAYATNGTGTYYGQEVSFTTTSLQVGFSSLTADSVSAGSAIVSGSITNDDGITINTGGICWGGANDPTAVAGSFVAADMLGFTVEITGLKANTLYYLRSFVISGTDTLYSENDSIITLPIVITSNITYVAADYAIGGGVMGSTQNGGATVTRGVCISTLPNPTNKDRITRNGTGTGAFYSPIKSLQATTTYYVRAYASNAGGTAYGEEKMFTTLEKRKITFSLSMKSNPTADEASAYKSITAAMDSAVRYYDVYTNYTKSLYVQYAPGVPTAQASNNGSIQFGSNRAYMKTHTAMHEISHTLGVGQNSSWWVLMVNNRWQGDSANYALQQISGNPTDTVHGDNAHFWPHGLNFESEGTSPTDFMHHCLIMEGMRKDGL